MSNKTKKAIFAWIIVIGWLLMLGALNGVERQTMAVSEFWPTAAISVAMIIVGFRKLKKLGFDEDED